jgi:hypothetical protein
MSSGTVAKTISEREWRQWAEEELGGAGFGDKRLDNRLVNIVTDFMGAPQESIPRASDNWPAAKGTYRFFSNKKVDPEIIYERHRVKVVERAKTEPIVLAIGDTTVLDYSSHPETKGLGPIKEEFSYGMLFQPVLLVTPERVPLGLIDQQTWVREAESLGKSEHKKLPIDQKESFKWLKSMEASERLQRQLDQEKTQVISIFDREGDIFDILAKATSSETASKLIVRACQDRRVEEPQSHLWGFMESQPVRGTFEVSVPRKKGCKERQAELAIRFSLMTISPPQNRKSEKLKSVEVFCVYVQEEHPPKGAEAIDWMLLTTVPVLSVQDATQIVEWYTCRWMVEVFFKVLKSGCKAEERQLETAERLKRCLALDSVVAWRILYLTTVGRKLPDLPCTVVFEEFEWKGLWVFVHKSTEIPRETPKLQEVVRLIGRLGGHLGRKSDGQPGILNMWRGLQRLPDIAEMWCITRGSSQKDL